MITSGAVMASMSAISAVFAATVSGPFSMMKSARPQTSRSGAKATPAARPDAHQPRLLHHRPDFGDNGVKAAARADQDRRPTPQNPAPKDTRPNGRQSAPRRQYRYAQSCCFQIPWSWSLPRYFRGFPLMDEGGLGIVLTYQGRRFKERKAAAFKKSGAKILRPLGRWR